ncbi:hypothetical protein [Runella sp.]|uniref:hypothetical protein n=1 Tax=Runella sp. TaxID=1960881 RepID=UPI003D0C674F
MNTVPGITDAEAPPFTDVEMQFQSLPKEVQVRILAQHCDRLLKDNDTLEAENKYLREKNAELKQANAIQKKINDNTRIEIKRQQKDLNLYRKFVNNRSVVGLFNKYCKANARNK